MREIAQLYGTEVSLEAIEERRQASGLQSLTSTCFQEARISALLIDDGLKLDKKHDIEWHKSFVPFVGRVLRIETLAEQILDEDCPVASSWDLDSFTRAFVGRLNSYPFNLVNICFFKNEYGYSVLSSVWFTLDFGHACSRDCCIKDCCCLS